MIIERDLDSLRISGVRELNAANAFVLEKMVSAARTGDAKDIELDLSETFALDSSGLGALIALRNAAERPGGVVRLVNPTPLARRILELTCLHRVLEIAQQEKRPAGQQSEYLNEAGSSVSDRAYRSHEPNRSRARPRPRSQEEESMTMTMTMTRTRT